MKLKIFVILAGTLLAYVTHTADHAIILKAKDGQKVEIKHELAQQSGLLNAMLDEPGFMELKDLDINLWRKVPELLEFAQKHPIEFPADPTLQKREIYQKNITKIVAEFNRLYSRKASYTDIFKIARFFDIPVIMQVIGQVRALPEMDLEMLQQHKYRFGPDKSQVDPEFQDCVALQLKREMDLKKEQYFEGKIVPHDTNSYFKGVSIRDYIDHGKTQDLLSGYHEGMLVLSNRALCSLEGLEKLFELVGPIRILDLSHNRLTTIPADIPGTGTVTVLRLNNNKISVIPHKITGWNNLRELVLYFNQIKTIPKAIVGLENLERLVLACNEIQEIPRSIERLDSLGSLTLVLNKISDASENVTELQVSLQRLDLGSNPMEPAEYNVAPGKRKLQSLQDNFPHKRPRKEGNS